MDDVARHYEELLAEHYTWMMGVSFDAKAAEQDALLRSLGLDVHVQGAALDLGCGPGFQSVALARLGYAPVIAIDTSQALLDELRSHAAGLPIEPARADLRDLAKLIAPRSAAAVVCMGDTLTHLESLADVSKLFAGAHTVLAPGGVLVLTFRDLSVELTGLDRFFAVRADADKIMTCVLDYEPRTVVVSDLIYVRYGDVWILRKSSYRKLRLAPEAVARELAALGFTVRRNEAVGQLHAIIAAK